MDRIIIGISGRKESGKSVLSQISEEYGFKVVRFAEPLKCLISKLIYVKRSDLDSLKTVQRKYEFHDADYKFLAEETHIPFSCVKETLVNKQFTCVRDLLQIIGTDLIRTYQEDWHVRKTLDYINSDELKDKNIIIDDLRFLNERHMIESQGGSCWFITRPKVDNISNHISETSLHWQDFDNLIINDESVMYLEHNWRIFLEHGYWNSLAKRQEVMDKIIGNKDALDELKNSKGKFTALEALFISKYEFTYEPIFAYESHNVKLLWHDNKTIMIEYDNDKGEREQKVIANPWMIEDIKRYL